MQNYDYRNAADEYWVCSDGTERDSSGCIMLVCVMSRFILISFIFEIRTIPAVKEKDL